MYVVLLRGRPYYVTATKDLAAKAAGELAVGNMDTWPNVDVAVIQVPEYKAPVTAPASLFPIKFNPALIPDLKAKA